ncbi:predicted protein [Enterococcus faecalis T3]|nr:predicted protein [Enterococcus faecalis T3]
MQLAMQGILVLNETTVTFGMDCSPMKSYLKRAFQK